MSKSVFSKILITNLLFSCCVSSGFALTTINVSTAADAFPVAPAGSLREALNSINSAPTDDYNITFSVGATPISLANSLPPLAPGAHIVTMNTTASTPIAINGQNVHQAFFIVNGTSVTLQNFTLQNCVAKGGNGGVQTPPTYTQGAGGGGGGLGAGGGLFVSNGVPVTIDNVSFLTNQAIGGNGGTGCVFERSPPVPEEAGDGGPGGGGMQGTGGIGGIGFSSDIEDLRFAGGGGGGGGGFLAGSNGANGVPNVGGAGAAGGNNSVGAGGGTGGSAGSFTSGGTGGNATLTFAGGGGGGGGGFSGGEGGGGTGGTGGNGSDFGGGGGAGGGSGDTTSGSGFGGNAGNGGFGGGGGAGASSNWGGGGSLAKGGSGGFGAGGGGGGAGFSSDSRPGGPGGVSAFGGGNGAHGVFFHANGGQGGGGGGGAGFGGAIFVRETGTLIIKQSSLSGNSVQAGVSPSDATAALAAGSDIFLRQGGSLHFQLTSPLTISGSIAADNVGGAGGGLNMDTGALTLTGVNTYAGGTFFNGGTLNINAEAALGRDALTFNGGTLQLAANVTLTKAVTLTGLGIFDTNGSNLIVTSHIVGAGSLQKIGSGVLTLIDETNAYLGGTTISAGTLQIPADGSLGNTAGTLTFDGGTLRIINDTTLARSITINSGKTAVFDSNDFTITCNGVISESAALGSLEKIGPGNLSLSATNTYAGGTTITGGILQISTNANLGNNTGVLTFNGGTLQALANLTIPVARSVNINPGKTAFFSGALTCDGPISGATGALEVLPSGALTLTNTGNSYGGGTILDTSNITISSGRNLGSGPVTIISGCGLVTNNGLTGVDQITQNINITSAGSSFVLTNTSPSNALISSQVSGSGALLAFAFSGGSWTFSANNPTTGFVGIGGNAFLTGAGNFASASIVSLFGGSIFDVSGATATVSNGGIIGDGTLALGSSTFTINNSFSDQFDGVITGTGATLQKNGAATLILTNTSPLSGTVLIDQGNVQVTGTLATADFTVQPSGILSGTGTVHSVINNGTVAPGASIGTLTVLGNYTQSASGTLENEIDDEGHSDFLNITGSATLAGTLEVVPSPGNYVIGEKYHVLHSVGGLGGTKFGSVVVTDPSVLLTAQYFSNDVFLIIGANQFFSGRFVTKRNPKRVESNLEALANNTQDDSDLLAVIDILEDLGTNQAITDGLDQMHPAAFSANYMINSQNNRRVSSVVERFPNLCSESCAKPTPKKDSMNLWTQPFGYTNEIKERQQLVGYNAAAGGFIMGVERVFQEPYILGIDAGFDFTHVKWKREQGFNGIWSYFVGLYANVCHPSFYCNLALLGGQNYYDTKREINFSTIHRKATSNHWANNAAAHFDASYDYKWSYCNHLQPYWDIDYSYLKEDGYHEDGAQSLNLFIKGKSTHVLRNELGIRLQRNIETTTYSLIPMIWLGWIYEKPFHSQYEARFQNLRLPYHVMGYRTAWNRVTTGLDMRYVWDQMSVALRYGLERGNSFTMHRGEVYLSWNF